MLNMTWRLAKKTVEKAHSAAERAIGDPAIGILIMFLKILMIGVDFEHRLLAVHQKRKTGRRASGAGALRGVQDGRVKHSPERRLVGPKGNQDLLGVGRKRVTIECEGHHAPPPLPRSCSSRLAARSRTNLWKPLRPPGS